MGTASTAQSDVTTNSAPAKPEAPILFQQYFKSGRRTYAAQVKQTKAGDHFLVLTDGRRDPETDELRKSMLFLFSQDFPAFFKMLHDTAQWIKANPVPEEVRQRQQQYKQRSGGKGVATGPAARARRPDAPQKGQ